MEKFEKMTNNNTEDFRARFVLTICHAGSDRSKIMADILDSRGYYAINRGVLNHHNYVMPEDFNGIGSIIFASSNEEREFMKDKELKALVEKNDIKVFRLSITEHVKNIAYNTSKTRELKDRISSELDDIGFRNLNE